VFDTASLLRVPQLLICPRAVSEARVGKKCTGARTVCALSIQRHEGSRPWLRRTRPYANSMVGRSGVEVWQDCAVVQGTRDCVGKRCWTGRIMLPGGQRKKTGADIYWEQDREMRSEAKRARNSSWRDWFHAANGGERS